MKKDFFVSDKEYGDLVKKNHGHSNLRLLLVFPRKQNSGMYVFLLNLIKTGFPTVTTISGLQSAKTKSNNLKHILQKKPQ